jgi:HEAT repeat protein/type 1 glutamine amidotransferase
MLDMKNKKTFLILVLLAAIFTLFQHVSTAEANGPHVTFIVAENEYDAAKTIPDFAQELENIYGFSCEVLQGGENNIPGLEILQDTDLAVIYVRRQVLPPHQIEILKSYVNSGKPVIGIRTASHAFCLNEEEPPEGLADWPEFDRDVLGGNYHMHHGNKSEDDPKTYVWVVDEQKSNPILEGVPKGETQVPSWLYKTEPLQQTATVLMIGRVGERKPYEPVTWINTNTKGGKVFYTSMGHPYEFNLPFFRQLLVNGVFWALDKPKPTEQQLVKELIKTIRSYDIGDARRPLTYISDLVFQADDDTKKKFLAEQIVKLLDSDTPFGCKQFACQQLSLIGSEEQVPAIAKLLADEESSFSACFALERINSPKADQALRDALSQTKGVVRIGIINSIGKKQDPKAVDELGKLLSESEQETAQAAALAMGMIGTKDAANQLKQHLQGASGKWHTQLAKAYLMCADRLVKQNQAEAAEKIYTEISTFENSHLQALALSGLVTTGNMQADEFVRKALSSDDKRMQIMALRYVRQMTGSQATKSFSTLLADLPAESQIMLLKALEDRSDKAAMGDVIKAAGSSDKEVRIAALEALGKVGNGRAVSLLIKTASTAKGEEQQAARQGLARLSSDDVDAAIASLLSDENIKIKIEAIKALAARQSQGFSKELLEMAKNDNEQIRLESWKALRQVATEKDFSLMISLWLKTDSAGQLEAAEDAVVTVARKMPSENQPGKTILTKIDSAKNDDVKASLYQALGRIGDESALPALKEVLQSDNRTIRNAAIRGLSYWPNDKLVEDLMAVASGGDEYLDRLLAMRAASNLLRESDRPVPEKISLYKQMMELAERTEDKKFVLGALGQVENIEVIKIVEPYIEDEDLKNEAGAAAAGIAFELDETDQIEDKETARYIMAVMQKIMANVENQSVRQPAGEVINRMKEIIED